jgi:hypothetical protein
VSGVDGVVVVGDNDVVVGVGIVVSVGYCVVLLLLLVKHGVLLVFRESLSKAIHSARWDVLLTSTRPCPVSSLMWTRPLLPSQTDAAADESPPAATAVASKPVSRSLWKCLWVDGRAEAPVGGAVMLAGRGLGKGNAAAGAWLGKAGATGAPVGGGKGSAAAVA